MTKTLTFEKILADFKSLLSSKRQRVLTNCDSFSKTINELKRTKESVYQIRLEELKSTIANNSDLFRLSTFELMEHNFRENSHSNILQYLFDYNNLGSTSLDIVQKIILSTNTDISKFISDNLIKKNYKVLREYPTEKGRIDILITDKINKFNIVIENKLLAEITVKEINEKSEITKTQLDDYYEYINSKFPDYKNLFFLLSYYSYEEELINYEAINYETVYLALKTTTSDDVVLTEYKSLLTSLLTGIDKRSISLSIQKVRNNFLIELNSIEKLNKIFTYETK
ncbi:MAG: PD-(D/E)XK nuclease family protein [Flavobacteriales bacterium]|nr:PD-(D/E)XK nuclease family protein [Flavobacteriales bacterium]